MAETKLNIYSIEEYDGECFQCSGGWSQTLLSHETKFTEEEFNAIMEDLEKTYEMVSQLSPEDINKEKFFIDELKEQHGFKPFEIHLSYGFE